MKHFDHSFNDAAKEIAKFLFKNNIYSLDVCVVWETDGCFKISASNIKGQEETVWFDEEGANL